MTRPVQQQRAEALYAWLLAQSPDQPLPRLRDIAMSVPCLRDAETAFETFRRLATQRRIEQCHGTRQTNPGHRIVRIIATGAVLKTDSCPLTLGAPADGAP